MFVILHFFIYFFLLQLIDWCWSSCSVAAGWHWCFVHAHMSWASNQERPVHLNFIFSHRWLTLMFCRCPEPAARRGQCISESCLQSQLVDWCFVHAHMSWASNQEWPVHLNFIFSHRWLTLMFCRCPEPAARRGQCISESCLQSQLVDWCFVHAQMPWASNQEWPVHLNFIFSHRWLTDVL